MLAFHIGSPAVTAAQVVVVAVVHQLQKVLEHQDKVLMVVMLHLLRHLVMQLVVVVVELLRQVQTVVL
jgi:hypothetical protein